MKYSEMLDLNKDGRTELWQHLFAAVESYMTNVDKTRVAPIYDLKGMRSNLNSVDFDRPLEPIDVLSLISQCLWDHQVHVAHPRYYGLFNPAPTTMGIVADALAAAFNPQLASWNHSPFAVEVERYLIKEFARKFGYDFEKADGTFTTGGTEANITALLTALVKAFPGYAENGLRGLAMQPTMYISSESHHSFIQAARICGLGTHAVREIAVDEKGKMDVQALAAQIHQDRKAGVRPFLLIASAGTTNSGVVDPLVRMAEIASEEKLWYHVDAAWGGAGVLVPELKPFLAGIDRSDSITFDSHKWLSVPMAAGLYLTRHPGILGETFRISADYLPAKPTGQELIDPYEHSIQCSRRFTGLKVFMSLAVAGWEGYSSVIRHQVALGDLLRKELVTSGWNIMNETKLPLVCFIDKQNSLGGSLGFLEAVAHEIVTSGKAWISVTRLAKKTPVLRACITNYRTEEDDIRALVSDLNVVREKIYRSMLKKE
jgi:glutamate/tyrosine decarboxylase-like PLP-dependent enzyme